MLDRPDSRSDSRQGVHGAEPATDYGTIAAADPSSSGCVTTPGLTQAEMAERIDTT